MHQVNNKDPQSLRIAYPILKFIVYILFLILGPIRVYGRNRIPKTGGVLIMANHISDIDVIALQLACPRRIYYMAKSELFEMPTIAWGIKWFGAFPVNRGTPDRKALQKAVQLLKEGCVVGIFPEGELSQTGKVGPLLPGAALIAKMGKVPVICCHITNTEHVLPYGKIIPRPSFRQIIIKWGNPLLFNEDASREEILGWVESQFQELSKNTQATE